MGDAESFAGVWRDEQADLRVHGDALLISRASGTERVSFSFARAVTAQDHLVTIEAIGREPVVLSMAGPRTQEFARLLAERVDAARSRATAFLASLLPGLGTLELRRAAGLLRDGVAVPATELDEIHPGLAGILLQVATLPARHYAVAELKLRAELAIGFKQITSLRRVTGGPGSAGLGSAGLGSAGGFGSAGGTGACDAYWAFRALGAGARAAVMGGRPQAGRGTLTPAADDPSALVMTGEDPAVLAFALGEATGRAVFEVLNHPGPPTMIYRLPKSGGLATVNRALDDCGFQPVGARATGLAAPVPVTSGARLLAGLVAGKAMHDADWPDRIAALLPS